MHHHFHLIVEHSSVHVDLRNAKDKNQISFVCILSIVCQVESTLPLVLNAINFKDLKVEGAAEYTYDGQRLQFSNLRLKVCVLFFFFFFFFFYVFFFCRKVSIAPSMCRTLFRTRCGA